MADKTKKEADRDTKIDVETDTETHTETHAETLVGERDGALLGRAKRLSLLTTARRPGMCRCWRPF